MDWTMGPDPIGNYSIPQPSGMPNTLHYSLSCKLLGFIMQLVAALVQRDYREGEVSEQANYSWVNDKAW